MTSGILGISGRKQAGKDTCSKFLHGVVMQRLGIVPWFKCDSSTNGRLILPVIDDGVETGTIDLELERVDLEFMTMMDNVVWDNIKQYGFADSLRDALIYLLGMNPEKVYGDDVAKKEDSPFGWAQFGIKKKGYMSNRDVLKEFAKIIRKINANQFVDNTFRAIESRQSKLSIIKDVRFNNEVEQIQKKGGFVVRLTRKVEEDNDISETDLDNYSGFDLVIDNQNMTIDEQTALLLEFADARYLLPQ